jgi:predicted DsbA family dithiol-disulfide isomerase
LITIDYFSDILCVWAYGGQIRLDALQREFGDRVLVRHRFMPLFADTEARIAEGWKDKDGFAGFGRHMQEVCAQWEHTRLHPGVWSECRPTSCTSAHVFLKAAALCLGVERDDAAPASDARRRFDRLVVETREAFFEQARDISSLPVLLGLLEGTALSADAVRARIDSGEAYAALHRDAERMKSYGVLGSPTYVFNEGRQLLYGNVGYRIIETNLRELMSAHRVEGEPSWC